MSRRLAPLLSAFALALGFGCAQDVSPEPAPNTTVSTGLEVDGERLSLGLSADAWTGSGHLMVRIRLPDVALEERVLLLDGEPIARGKTVGARYVLDTHHFPDGPHELALVVVAVDGRRAEARAEVHFETPGARVRHVDAPDVLFPGQRFVIEVELDGEAAEVSADFSAVDPGFDPAAVEVERRGDSTFALHYDVPFELDAAEGHHIIPVLVTDFEGRSAVIDAVRPYLTSGEALPLTSPDGFLSRSTAAAEGFTDPAADILEMDGQLSGVAGDELTFGLLAAGDLRDAELLISVEGYGGHLVVPLAGSDAGADDADDEEGASDEEAASEKPLDVRLVLPESAVLDEISRSYQVTVRLRDRYGSLSQPHILDLSVAWKNHARLSFTLRWWNGADLDLAVEDPSGNRIGYDRVSGPNGGRHYGDAVCGHAVGFEHVSWDAPTGGTYRVHFPEHSKCGAAGQTYFKLHVSGCGLDQEIVLPWALVQQQRWRDIQVPVCDRTTIQGKARYTFVSRSGSTSTASLAGTVIRILNAGGNIVGTSTVASDGTYYVTAPMPSVSDQPYNLQLVAADAEVEVVELNANPAVVQVATPANAKWNPRAAVRHTFDFTLPTNQSGAFHIFRTIKKGHAFYAGYGMRLTRTTARWTAGQDPVPTSHYRASTDQLSLLGRAADPDHFDDSIILHELSHRAQHHFSEANPPGGPHSHKDRINPALAWSEGVATFLGQAIIGDRRYVDRTSTGGIIYNIDDLAAAGSPTGTDDGTVSGRLSEGVVMAALWDLRDGHDASEHDALSGMTSAVVGAFKKLRQAKYRTRGVTRADLSDVVKMLGCGSDKKKMDDLLENRFGLDWLDEKDFCKDPL